MRLLIRLPVCTIVLLMATSVAAPAKEADLLEALRTLNNVGNVGNGHVEAMRAWRIVASSSAASLPQILRSIDDDKPLGANWIRAAADQIAERSVNSGNALPADRLEAAVFDQSISPRARRLAYEWLARVDDTARERIIPKSLNDSSVEMRREAVAQVLAKAEATDSKESKLQLYRTALSAARDTDQIDTAFEKLTDLGEEVDLVRHFGFVTAWQLIGPFDNSNKSGFAVDYPPEKELDFDAAYEGKTGEVKWLRHESADKYGMVDLNKAIGKNMGAAAYAAATFESALDQEVEFRLGCINASKVWLNGELLMSNEVYHSGTQIDQYVTRAQLKQGPNQILIKCCQNEQTEQWAQDWQFQFRVCDRVGSAIRSESR